MAEDTAVDMKFEILITYKCHSTRLQCVDERVCALATLVEFLLEGALGLTIRRFLHLSADKALNSRRMIAQCLHYAAIMSCDLIELMTRLCYIRNWNSVYLLDHIGRDGLDFSLQLADLLRQHTRIDFRLLAPL